MKTLLSMDFHELDFEHAGIDLALLESNLKLSYEIRLVEHQRALELVTELEEAGKRFYEEFK